MGMSLLGCGIVSQPTPTWSPSPTLNQDAPGKTLPSVKSNRPPKSRFWDDALRFVAFLAPSTPSYWLHRPQATRHYSEPLFRQHLVDTRSQVTTSARPILRRCGTRHLPSALPDSEFGDPEWGPLCMHDMLQKATFLGFLQSTRTRFSA